MTPPNWPVCCSEPQGNSHWGNPERQKGRLAFLFSQLDPEKMVQRSRGSRGLFCSLLLHGRRPLQAGRALFIKKKKKPRVRSEIGICRRRVKPQSGDAAARTCTQSTCTCQHLCGKHNQRTSHPWWKAAPSSNTKTKVDFWWLFENGNPVDSQPNTKSTSIPTFTLNTLLLNTHTCSRVQSIL